MRRLLLFLFIYVIIAAAAVLGWSVFFIKPPDMPYGGTFTYRACGAALAFFEVLGAVLCGGFICGESQVFGRDERSYAAKFSPSIIRALREALVCAVICTALVFAADEIGKPIMLRLQGEGVRRSERLTEYIAQARKFLNQKDYRLAETYAQKAQEIAPKNAEVQKLAADAEFGAVENRRGQEAETVRVLPGAASAGSGQYTAYELLQKAEAAFAQKAWFDAHFYATSVLEVTTERDPNYAQARRLASEAWNYLASPEPFTDREAAALYAKKRKGYDELMEGDALKAYYLFAELRQSNPGDPDVAHYLEIATSRTANRYFFLNEIPNLDAFRNLEEIYFSYQRADGGRDIVHIKGIAPLEDSGRIVLFLRQFSLSSYNAQGEPEMSVTAPFAKMFAQPVGSLDSQTRIQLGITSRQRNAPYIMLEGVDSGTEGVTMRPTFTFAKNVTPSRPNFLLLGIPYEDLLLVIDNTRGRTPVYGLLGFAPIADAYGFSREVYLHELYTRIARPLVFAVIAMLAALFAWHFRMSSSTKYFKLFWIVVPPVVTGVAYLVITVLQFAVSVAVYALVSAAGQGALVIILGAFFLSFAGTIAAFVTQREKSRVRPR